MRSRVLSVAIVIAMVFSLIPSSVFAADITTMAAAGSSFRTDSNGVTTLFDNFSTINSFELNDEGKGFLTTSISGAMYSYIENLVIWGTDRTTLSVDSQGENGQVVEGSWNNPTTFGIGYSGSFGGQRMKIALAFNEGSYKEAVMAYRNLDTFNNVWNDYESLYEYYIKDSLSFKYGSSHNSISGTVAIDDYDGQSCQGFVTINLYSNYFPSTSYVEAYYTPQSGKSAFYWAERVISVDISPSENAPTSAPTSAPTPTTAPAPTPAPTAVSGGSFRTDNNGITTLYDNFSSVDPYSVGDDGRGFLTTNATGAMYSFIESLVIWGTGRDTLPVDSQGQNAHVVEGTWNQPSSFGIGYSGGFSGQRMKIALAFNENTYKDALYAIRGENAELVWNDYEALYEYYIKDGLKFKYGSGHDNISGTVAIDHYDGQGCQGFVTINVYSKSFPSSSYVEAYYDYQSGKSAFYWQQRVISVDISGSGSGTTPSNPTATPRVTPPSGGGSATPTPAPTVPPINIGDTITVYGNPGSGLNTRGRSYFYGVSTQRTIQADGDSAIGRNFEWGDGMMFEPDVGSLIGRNTRITIGHYVSNGGSDLCAEVIYEENGVRKLTKSYGFTGYHKDGRQQGDNNSFSEIYLGTFPNVISVNIWHVMQPDNSWGYNDPKFGYVKFETVGNAGSISEASGMYIETRVRSRYARGKKIADLASPMAVPAPIATPIPYANANVNHNSGVASLGYGATITIHPSEYAGVNVEDNPGFTRNENGSVNYNGGNPTSPFTLYNVSKNLTVGGVCNLKIASDSGLAASSAGACYGRITACIGSGNGGSSAEFIPTAGSLNNTDTKISIIGMGNEHKVGSDAIVTYNGGQTQRVTLIPANTLVTDSVIISHAGVFRNVEKVEVIATNGGYWNVPTVIFRVVNDDMSKPTPSLASVTKSYQRPNINQITPAAPAQLPVKNASSSVSINEVCSDNKGIILDSFGKKSDWIELYNSGNSEVNLSGYGITDDPSLPFKYIIGSATVPAHGYLTIFASGNDIEFDNEVHTNFSISKDGEPIMLSNPEGGVISIVDVPALGTNKTVGFYPDGSNNLNIMYGTPNSANTSASIDIPFVPAPQFSAESGFYNNSFTLSVASPSGATIHYTTDGSEPTASSPVLTATNIYNRTSDNNVVSAIQYPHNPWYENDRPSVPSVKIDKCTVIKAVAIDGSGHCSDVITKTYFVGLNIKNDYNNEAVISIAMNNDDLFSTESGIFANANERTNLWDKRTHMTMFEGDGTVVLDQDCKISVRGLAARGEEQKSLTFKASGDYGESTFDYDIFQGKAKSFVTGEPITEFGSFALRGGLDSMRSNGSRWVDPALQSLAEKLGIAWQAARGCNLFINGEYWGHYYLQERVGTDYLEAHYGVDEDDVALFKTSNSKGSTTHADENVRSQDYDFLSNRDFDNLDNYKQLEAKYDVADIMLYYAVNFATVNYDWGSYNYAIWRSRNITDEKYEDGKWRCMLYDLDACHINGNSYGQESMYDDNLMKAFRTNPSLKKRFVNALMDVYHYYYNLDSVVEEMDYWHKELHQVTNKQWDRWGHPAWSYEYGGQFNNKLSNTETFYQIVREKYGVTGKLAYMTFKTNDENKGQIKINDLPLGSTGPSYSCRYFNDYTVRVEAFPKEGYKFVRWQTSDGTNVSSSTDPLTFVSIPDNGGSVVAIFEADSNYPGSENNPFVISSENDLRNMANNVNSGVNTNSYYVLNNDITVSGSYVAIGTDANPFNGNFNGQYHTISNITIDNTTQGQGLFGYVGENGNIKNVGVINITINGGKNVGGIVGNNNGTISNCYSGGTLNGASTVGGIAGNNKAGTVKNCFSVATINSSSASSGGGVTGKTEVNGTVNNCYSLVKPVGKEEGTVTSSRVATEVEMINGTVKNLLNNGGSGWKNGVVCPAFQNGSASISISNGYANLTANTIVYGNMIIANYNSNGRMTEIKIVPVSSAASVKVPSTMTGTVKAFLVNNTDAVMPIVK